MENRIRLLQRRLAEEGLDAVLLVYSRDVLYYTGTAQPSCLLVTPYDYTLYVRSGFEFAVQDVFIGREKLLEERRLEKILAGALSRLAGKPGKIGTELDILTAEQFEALRKAGPGVEFINISPITLEQRKVKEPGEIERLRRACDAVHAGHEAVLATLREGVTELELAAAVENAHRLAGHEGIFFIRLPDFFMSRGPIGAGPNLLRNSGVVYTITGVGMSPAVPAGPSRRAIGRGETVIVDIPTLVEGYHADQTRTYCLGKAGEAIHALYGDLLAVADYLIGTIRPGMTGRDVYRMARQKANDRGRSAEFMSFGGGKASRILGHGIGLELNEPPILSEHDTSSIPESCVVALDMHMMAEGGGVVKLEDMIHVGRGGNEILTRSPRRLFEV
ncbi:MAG: aminopeptidase P family protein [Candidatus Aminicenantes bacterium]|jgi:Xaa-Pro dipeptidase|nr:aminopeptidase P family protein [Candidatus Aminicenantes bacterium]